MNLPDAAPTRKQRFEAALKLAGLTVEQWRTEHYPISAQHLNEVWKNDIDASAGRTPSAELNAAIDGIIAKYLTARIEAAPGTTQSVEGAVDDAGDVLGGHAA